MDEFVHVVILPWEQIFPVFKAEMTGAGRRDRGGREGVGGAGGA